MLKMSDPVIQAIVQARVALLFDDPWYGNLVTRLEVVAANEVDAVHVGYRELRYNQEAVRHMTPPQLTACLREGIDALIAGLAGPPISTDDQVPRQEFIAAVINANVATGRKATDQLAHLDAKTPRTSRQEKEAIELPPHLSALCGYL
ncbi:hypothetical protein [Sphingomonas sp. Leaf28]|uniref:hypothetical protein n=1 Tax=Sphingomonas sp. Leaf28 TaxID=1735695 RepID=UPI0006FB8EC1|nr:hypothetical protein [Sphingomonas sp. Leaf28]KQN09097.1 hypothetical protein ASE79_14695 [Sphingomonas sp. Leaf28]